MSDRKIELIEIVKNYKDVIDVIEELSEDGKKTKYLKGVFGQSEAWNRNKRWYQKKEVTSEVNRFNEKVIPENRAVGELDHSDNSDIQLHRLSHRFEELWMDGNDMCGKARVVETAFGKTLSVIIDEKIPFGVSTKGMGSLSKYKKKGKSGNLVTNYEMRSPGDVVYNQSAPKAVPAVVTEMIMDGDKRMEDIFSIEIVENAKDIYESSKSGNLTERSIDVWNFLKNVEINK